MIINKSGMTIRTPVSTLRVMGRATQGVKVINLRNDDSIASVTVVPKEEESPEETESDVISSEMQNTAEGMVNNETSEE